MRELELLIRGTIAGLIIAAPVGPVNVLCIQRTIAKGWRSGVISGVGAAAADTLYGAVAGFSITYIIQFLIREQFWIRIVGGALLVAIGISYLFKRPRDLQEKGKGGTEYTDVQSTFLLNLTNPTTVLSFLAVLATLGIEGGGPWWLGTVLVAGIFCGSMLWWIVLASAVNHFRDRFGERTMVWMNRIAGVAIGGFGIAAMVLSKRGG